MNDTLKLLADSMIDVYMMHIFINIYFIIFYIIADD